MKTQVKIRTVVTHVREIVIANPSTTIGEIVDDFLADAALIGEQILDVKLKIAEEGAADLITFYSARAKAIHTPPNGSKAKPKHADMPR